jgi:tetratricopeptide (TPR) repeat protein
MTLKSSMVGIRFILLFAAALFAAGCSGGAGSENVNSAAQAQQPQPPANPQEITDANIALAEGTRLFEYGDTDRAIEMLNRAVELDPDLAEAYFKLGVAYALVEARDASVVETQVEPTPAPEKGKEEKKKTRSEEAFEKAVEAYKKHLEANPEDDLAYFNLGRSYNKLNEDKEAAKALKEAVKLKPDDTEYQTELGAILVKLAEYAEAIPPLKKATDLDPENTRAIELLEDAEAGKRRIDYAAERAKKEMQANSNSAGKTSDTPANTNSANTNPPEIKGAKTPPTAANRPN